MLYRVGTKRELPIVANRLPKAVYEELCRGTAILDAEYGKERDYLQSGGYSVIAETREDLPQLKAIINHDAHPCEWVTRIDSKDGSYLSILYLLNDDYSIVVYLPAAIAPNTILSELED